MTRLNLLLFFALIFSSLGLVNAQHRARKQYIELEQMNQDAKQYEQEYGQLQLEQSTWAMHSRVELIATQQLQMQVPDSKRVQVVMHAVINTVKINSTQLPVSQAESASNKPSATADTDISVKFGVQNNVKERPESQVEQAYRIDSLSKKQNNASLSVNQATTNQKVLPKAPTILPSLPSAEVKH